MLESYTAPDLNQLAVKVEFNQKLAQLSDEFAAGALARIAEGGSITKPAYMLQVQKERWQYARLTSEALLHIVFGISRDEIAEMPLRPALSKPDEDFLLLHREFELSDDLVLLENETYYPSDASGKLVYWVINRDQLLAITLPSNSEEFK